MYAAGQSERWGEWGDWIWSDEHGRYFHQRQDAFGNIDTDWAPIQQPAAPADIPRGTDESIDDLAAGLSNASLQDTGSAYGTYEESYSVASGRDKGKRPRKARHRHGRKGKNRAAASESDDDDTERDEPSNAAAAPEPAPGGAQYTYGTDGRPYGTGQPGYTYDQDPYYQNNMASPNAAPAYPVHPAAADDVEAEESAEMQEAMLQSQAYNYGNQAAGESSSSAYQYYEEEPQPRPSASVPRSHIAGTEGNYEQLDPRYRIEHSNKFQPGEIFKVLWSEPQGTGTDHAPSLVSESREMQDRYGGKFFVGFRRFVVVANDQGHCTCVPILTYGGKACLKRGVKPEKHGIIHERRHKAKLLHNEPKLGFLPVKVEITEEGETLSRESRVNYSKLVTVEHNVKVLFIGHVVNSDWETVHDAVNYCWEKKSKYGRKHRP